MDDFGVVDLGVASKQTREPVYPPYYFDGYTFQYFQPYWL